jgi:hypothetical protein
MRRALLLITAITACGCLTTSDSGPPPGDPACHLVSDALHADTWPSFEKHILKAEPNAKVHGPLASGSAGGHEWCATFVCPNSADAAPGKTRLLSAAECKAILTAVQVDVSATVARTGVDVSQESAVEVTDGPKPEAKFVIRYSRKRGEVAGEVVGQLAPDSGPGEPWMKMKVTLREWVRK